MTQTHDCSHCRSRRHDLRMIQHALNEIAIKLFRESCNSQDIEPIFRLVQEKIYSVLEVAEVSEKPSNHLEKPL